jgi:glutamate formiminotransferase
MIIESVPNFSEGRRPAVVAAIVDAIQAPDVLLLNYSSDWDHNRTVVTIAGPPQAVLTGLLQATRVAAELIDLRVQRGAHPRLGAADVIPLIPLGESTLADCVTLARTLGKQIGERLQLPVYLYEAAATRPERRLLADVRRGEYETLVREIGLPLRAPDFGPAAVGPAGAVIVGARPFLIAYNIYLTSSDVQIAKAISRAIRERDGGLPAVRALGLLVNDQAQVSLPSQRVGRHVWDGGRAQRTDRVGARGRHACSGRRSAQVTGFHRQSVGGTGAGRGAGSRKSAGKQSHLADHFDRSAAVMIKFRCYYTSLCLQLGIFAGVEASGCNTTAVYAINQRCQCNRV